MTVNGSPIDDYSFRPPAAVIAYTQEYEWEQARIWAGISIPEWDAMPGSRAWIDANKGGRSKSDILILFRMQNLIPAAASDAQARQSEREAKMKRPR